MTEMCAMPGEFGDLGVVYAFQPLAARREFWSQGPVFTKESDTVVFPLHEQSVST